MNRFTAVLILALAVPLVAGDPEGLVYWPSSQLKGFQKALAPKLDQKKVASETLGKFGNHSVMVAHREGSGESELHETVADVFIVQSGEATLVVGGKLIGGKTTAPGEVRGTSIEGGVKQKLGPGDMAHIPANTPHQTLLDAGKQLTYVIVKVEQK